jgi:hypothetical protein
MLTSATPTVYTIVILIITKRRAVKKHRKTKHILTALQIK